MGSVSRNNNTGISKILVASTPARQRQLKKAAEGGSIDI